MGFGAVPSSLTTSTVLLFARVRHDILLTCTHNTGAPNAVIIIAVNQQVASDPTVKERLDLVLCILVIASSFVISAASFHDLLVDRVCEGIARILWPF